MNIRILCLRTKAPVRSEVQKVESWLWSVVHARNPYTLPKRVRNTMFQLSPASGRGCLVDIFALEKSVGRWTLEQRAFTKGCGSGTSRVSYVYFYGPMKTEQPDDSIKV